MVLLSVMADIALISLALNIVSKAVQSRFVNRDKMKADQAAMKERQKKMQELAKKNDAKSKNELEALEKEMMESMQQMLGGTNKVLIFSLVVFLPVFWLLGNFYGAEIINLPIALPWLANGFDLFKFATWGIDIYQQTTWFGWYFVTYLFFSLILGALEKFFPQFRIDFSKKVL